MTTTKTSPWLIAFRIVFTLGLIWTVMFIFGNSLEVAEVSGAHSQGAMHWLNAKLALLHLPAVSEGLVRKLAHLAEFCLLGFLATLCLRVYTRRFVRHMSWPLLFGLLVANMDETIQAFIPGRSSRLVDVWIDFTGVIVGLFIALFILLFCRMCGIILNAEEDSL